MDFRRLDLSGCMLADRAQLRREMQLWSRRTRERQPVDRVEPRITQLYERSRAAVNARRALKPNVTYPDSLPITALLPELRAAVNENQVVVLAGETGSGKTTQLPKLCLEMGRGICGMIGHTQPRRLAARTVAARVAQELSVTVGQEVGFAIRFTDQVSDRTLVKVMTDGILLNEITRDPELWKYDTLIIDEAHERSLNIDFLLGYLKSLQPRRPDLKIIITSATIDVQRFSQHFGGAPVVQVEGRGFPVDVVYAPGSVDEDGTAPELDRQVADVYREIVAAERSDKRRNDACDILVFLPGEREILETARNLRRANLPDDPDILPLYSRLPNAEQQRIFNPGPARRIVLTTNVAETSLTVPRVGYVIDAGVARISRYSFRSKLQRLPVEPISKASAEQRKGRCGRVAPGVCFRLYSEQDFLARPDYTDAEILRTNLASVVLQLKAMRLGELASFPLLDAPETRAITDAHRLLSELQALQGERLTPLGKTMSRLPIDPRLARMLLAAVDLKCLREVLIIVSALSVQDPRERRADALAASDASHAEWRDPNSDFMSYVRLWDWFELQRAELSRSGLRTTCSKRHLSFLRLLEWRDVHRQLTTLLAQMGHRPASDDSEPDVVHQALLPGLLSLIGQKGEQYDYQGPRGMKFFVFPGSSLFRKRPQWIAAAEIVETSRVYARTVCAVQPLWIERCAQHLLRRHHTEPHWHRKRAEVVAFEQVTLYGLVLAERRLVGYSSLDPDLARRIFIRDALAPGNMDDPPDCIRRNCRLVDEVKDLEDRLRQRGLVVDEDSLCDFYDALLPNHVADQRTFADYLKKHPERMSAWYMRREFVLQQVLSAHKLESQFPSSLVLDDVDYQLKYRFAPGEVFDGVSIVVPTALLMHVTAAWLSWLVPGYLEPLCEAWIRSLPKQWRRPLGPMPELLHDLLPLIAALAESRGTHLLHALSEQIGQARHVQIPADAWDRERVPMHLKFCIEVADDKGKVLARERSLTDLQARFRASDDDVDWRSVKAALELAEIANFPADGVPSQRLVETAAGKRLLYPALINRGESIALRFCDSAEDARAEHRRGVLKLLVRSLGKAARRCRQLLDESTDLYLRFVTLGSAVTLQEQLWTAAIRRIAEPDLADVRDPQMFEEIRSAIATRIEAELALVAVACTQVLRSRAALLSLLDRSVSPAYRDAVQDLRSWLDRLLPPDFLTVSGADRLSDFERYLQAAIHRAENLQGRVERDARHLQSIMPLEQRIAALVQADSVDRAGVLALRWRCEELRVATFAPNVRVVERTSVQRVERELAEFESRSRFVKG